MLIMGAGKQEPVARMSDAEHGRVDAQLDEALRF
jgi:hypothetical protein